MKCMNILLSLLFFSYFIYCNFTHLLPTITCSILWFFLNFSLCVLLCFYIYSSFHPFLALGLQFTPFNLSSLKCQMPYLQSLRFFTTGSMAMKLLNSLPFQHKADTTEPVWIGHFSEWPRICESVSGGRGYSL